MVLASGSRIGHAVVGVWLSAALLAVAVMWMLLGWLRYRWALLGGVLSALQFGMAGSWAQSYWGGAVAGIGGALIFGAAQRLDQRAEWSLGIPLGIGCSVLVFSRPFEGLVVFLMTLGYLAFRRFRRRGGLGLGKALASSAMAGLVCFPLLAAYNARVTGDPLTTPYQLHTLQNDAAPLFHFQPSPATPTYRHERLERFHTEWEYGFYDEQQNLSGWLTFLAARPVIAIAQYGFGPPRASMERCWLPGLLVLPFFLIVPLARRPRSRQALGVVLLFFLALSSLTYFVAHYLAVLTGFWMLLVVESLRVTRAGLRRHGAARKVIPLAIGYSAVLVCLVAHQEKGKNSDPDFWTVERETVEDELAGRGDSHLVLVRYSAGYPLHSEWVYNSAEIDEQTVVWARDMGEVQNRGIVQYYADRDIWRLDLSPGVPPSLSGY